MATKPTRLRANSKMFAAEVWLEMRKALSNGQVLTRWKLQPMTDDPRESNIEFEIRVTRLGDCQLPRSQKLIDRIWAEGKKS